MKAVQDFEDLLALLEKHQEDARVLQEVKKLR